MKLRKKAEEFVNDIFRKIENLDKSQHRKLKLFKKSFDSAVESLNDDELQKYLLKHRERFTNDIHKRLQEIGECSVTTLTLNPAVAHTRPSTFDLLTGADLHLNEQSLSQNYSEEERRAIKLVYINERLSDITVSRLIKLIKDSSTQNTSDDCSTQVLISLQSLQRLCVSTQTSQHLQIIMCAVYRLSSSIELLKTADRSSVQNIAEELKNFLWLCHVKARHPETFDKPSYEDLCSALLSLYIDLILHIHRKQKNPVELSSHASHICETVCYLLEGVAYRLDALLQLSVISQTTPTNVNPASSHCVLLTPIIRKVLGTIPQNLTDPALYTRYISAVRLYSNLLPQDLMLHIVQQALRIPAPQDYLTWIKSGDSSILDEIPLTKKFRKTKITRFLLQEASVDLINSILDLLTDGSSSLLNDDDDDDDKMITDDDVMMIVDKKGDRGLAVESFFVDKQPSEAKDVSAQRSPKMKKRRVSEAAENESSREDGGLEVVQDVEVIEVDFSAIKWQPSDTQSEKRKKKNKEKLKEENSVTEASNAEKKEVVEVNEGVELGEPSAARRKEKRKRKESERSFTEEDIKKAKLYESLNEQDESMSECIKSDISDSKKKKNKKKNKVEEGDCVDAEVITNDGCSSSDAFAEKRKKTEAEEVLIGNNESEVNRSNKKKKKKVESGGSIASILEKSASEDVEPFKSPVTFKSPEKVSSLTDNGVVDKTGEVVQSQASVSGESSNLFSDSDASTGRKKKNKKRRKDSESDACAANGDLDTNETIVDSSKKQDTFLENSMKTDKLKSDSSLEIQSGKKRTKSEAGSTDGKVPSSSNFSSLCSNQKSSTQSSSALKSVSSCGSSGIPSVANSTPALNLNCSRQEVSILQTSPVRKLEFDSPASSQRFDTSVPETSNVEMSSPRFSSPRRDSSSKKEQTANKILSPKKEDALERCSSERQLSPRMELSQEKWLNTNKVPSSKKGAELETLQSPKNDISPERQSSPRKEKSPEKGLNTNRIVSPKKELNLESQSSPSKDVSLKKEFSPEKRSRKESRSERQSSTRKESSSLDGQSTQRNDRSPEKWFSPRREANPEKLKSPKKELNPTGFDEAFAALKSPNKEKTEKMDESTESADEAIPITPAKKNSSQKNFTLLKVSSGKKSHESQDLNNKEDRSMNDDLIGEKVFPNGEIKIPVDGNTEQIKTSADGSSGSTLLELVNRVDASDDSSQSIDDVVSGFLAERRSRLPREKTPEKYNTESAKKKKKDMNVSQSKVRVDMPKSSMCLRSRGVGKALQVLTGGSEQGGGDVNGVEVLNFDAKGEVDESPIGNTQESYMDINRSPGKTQLETPESSVGNLSENEQDRNRSLGKTQLSPVVNTRQVIKRSPGNFPPENSQQHSESCIPDIKRFLKQIRYGIEPDKPVFHSPVNRSKPVDTGSEISEATESVMSSSQRSRKDSEGSIVTRTRNRSKGAAVETSVSKISIADTPEIRSKGTPKKSASKKKPELINRDVASEIFTTGTPKKYASNLALSQSRSAAKNTPEKISRNEKLSALTEKDDLKDISDELEDNFNSEDLFHRPVTRGWVAEGQGHTRTGRVYRRSECEVGGEEGEMSGGEESLSQRKTCHS